MQGLRPLVQDENSLGALPRGGLAPGKLGGELGGLKAAGLPGARKALGNITNRGGFGENAPPAKTPAAAGPRRALGDTTNAAKPPGTQQQPRAAEKPAAPAAAAAAARPMGSLAEAYAAEGVERLAGKGWEELEADRAARADAEMDQRLLAFAALGKRSLPTFFPLWVSSRLVGSPVLQWPAWTCCQGLGSGEAVGVSSGSKRKDSASCLPCNAGCAVPMQGAAKMAVAPQEGLQREALPALPASPCMPRQQLGAWGALGMGLASCYPRGAAGGTSAHEERCGCWQWHWPLLQLLCMQFPGLHCAVCSLLYGGGKLLPQGRCGRHLRP